MGLLLEFSCKDISLKAKKVNHGALSRRPMACTVDNDMSQACMAEILWQKEKKRKKHLKRLSQLDEGYHLMRPSV